MAKTLKVYKMFESYSPVITLKHRKYEKWKKNMNVAFLQGMHNACRLLCLSVNVRSYFLVLYLNCS